MRQKLLFYVLLSVFFAVVFVVDLKRSFGIFLKDDYRLAVMADDGIGLVSVSPSRGVVNFAQISGDTYVWIPGGYGWYGSNKVVRLLEQEQKKGLIDDILFYNFGFEAKTVLWTDSVVNWDQWSNLFSGLGLIPSTFARWRFDNMFFKEDFVSGDLVDNIDLDEMLRREFSDNVLVEEGIRVSVFNDSGLDLLAGWVASRLSWAGLSVLSVGDWQGESVSECVVLYNENLNKSSTMSFFDDRFNGCDYVISDEVSDGEVEIVLGRSWAEMIDYKSYVRTF